MRTLEEVLANIPVSWSSVTAWDARELIREAHALGRSEMEAEVAKLRAERDEAKKNLDAACDALRMAGQVQHKYRIDRNAAESEVARLRAEGEERERALREALEKIAALTCIHIALRAEVMGRIAPCGDTEPCSPCLARAALRQHEESKR